MIICLDSKLQDEVYGRMMLKSKDQTYRTQGFFFQLFFFSTSLK